MPCWGAAIMENIVVFLKKKKLKIKLLHDPAVSLLVIYLKKTKTLIQKDICTLKFIAVLYAIIRILKQPNCPSVNV